MTTLLRTRRSHLFLSRYPYAWLETWAKWDCHNIIVSVTILTVTVGIELVWKSPHTSKGCRQFIIYR